MAGNIIHVENITKAFKVYKKKSGITGYIKSLFSRQYEIKTAVDNISFDIDAGEIVGYIGSNGAGKSTTIKIMTGILVPTNGICMVDGMVPYKNRQKNAMKIGVVFGQRTQLWWDLALRETFLILKDIYEIGEEEYEERLEFLNEVLDLNAFIDSPVRTLSLGQRMRGDLAASLLHNPKILFLDEPTIGLDVVVKEKILKAIKMMNKKYNTTVILTTHELKDIEELCDRILIIDKGQKVYDGSITEIKRDYGYMRTIEISLENTDNIEKIDLAKQFSLSKEDMASWIKDKSFFVNFNRNKVTASEIVSYIMSVVAVVDFSIKETEIGEIVKKIYANGVKI